MTAHRQSSKRLTLTLFLLVLFLGLISACRLGSPKRPNVILIVVDTLRADHLSSYGYFRKTTPFIDELSRDSIIFKNAISSAPWTTPSLASLFASRYPAALGFEGEEPIELDESFVTLAEVFKHNRYMTKGIVSHDFISSRLKFDQGFDSYDQTNARGYGYVSSPSVTNLAVSFINGHKKEKFFLFLHYFDPHFDYILHKEFDYYPDYRGSLQSGEHKDSLLARAQTMSADDLKYLNAVYDSEISFTDMHIGRFLKELKRLGLYDSALIIFTSDHGEGFVERKDYWIGHTKKLYQELIHVPLIIKLPRNKKKKVINEYVGLVDLMPTIIGHIGLKTPAGYICAGQRIDLKGNAEPESRAIISDARRMAKLQSVIWKNWKLIYDQQKDTKELYDLKNDPLETQNLAAKNPQKLAEFQDILKRWKEQIVLIKSEYEIKAKRPDFSEEEKSRLRSLGYIK